jgi:hypothetical protein
LHLDQTKELRLGTDLAKGDSINHHVRKLTSAFLVLVLIAATQLSAATITLTSNELLGTVMPATPANENNATEQVRFLVNAYNSGALSGSLLGNNPADPYAEVYTLYRPTGAPGTLSAPVSNGKVDTSNPVVALGGITYQYVLYFQANSAWVYYIGNISGNNSINWGGNPVPNPASNVNGSQISHYVLFNPGSSAIVPDKGATALLIGLGLVILGLAARRKKSV